jgi:hypothetical protein
MLEAVRFGTSAEGKCKNCGAEDGQKLDADTLWHLAHRFFVWGTLHRVEYGAAPLVRFSSGMETGIKLSPWLEHDVHLFEKALGVGFFLYGPRLWMVGFIEPLRALEDNKTRSLIIQRILSEYPTTQLTPDRIFYRVRTNPTEPSSSAQYDSSPSEFLGRNRLDSANLPILYSSEDLPVCLHELRVAAEDNIFVASLRAKKSLHLLDLTEVIDENVTEFESLDLAVHMLFLAGKHSYNICRDIALAAHAHGFDGLLYPSYFSLLRTGFMPFETSYGLSLRKYSKSKDYEKSKMIPNIALFGRPIQQDIVAVHSINKVILRRVDYDFHFGPTEC